MSRTPERMIEARRQLYAAAMALFRQKGFAATSVDEIAAKAGFSRATFFNHFGSKAAVLRFYGQEVGEKVRIAEDRAACERPLERLKGVLVAMASEAEAQRENLRIVFAHSVRDPDYFAKPTAAREGMLDRMAALIAAAQDEGKARSDLSARELAQYLMGLHDQATVAILFAGAPARATVERLWQFALGGLTRDAGGGGRRSRGEKGVRR